VEGRSAASLAERFGTPLYVISESRLRANARRWRAAVQNAWTDGPTRVLPSLKANTCLALHRILTQEELGADVFGPGEFRAAMLAGVEPSSISLNGSAKDQAVLDEAVRAGARITLDSRPELARVLDAVARAGRPATVRLRARPSFPDLDAPTDFVDEEVPTSEAIRRYKAGIPTDDLLAMGTEILARDDIHLSGLHVHVARHRADVKFWRSAVATFAAFVGRATAAWEGWRPAELDLGGGFATGRDPTGRLIPRLAHRPGAPTVEEYAETVAGALRDGLAAEGMDPAGITLEVEPGRSMFADAGIHLATVRNVKREAEPTPWIWIETDTTEMFLLDSIVEHNRWTVVAADHADAPAAVTADVVGTSCGFDLMVPDAALPDPAEGDLLAFLDTGAYQDASSTNFNALPRPATVLVSGESADIIKRRETLDDVFARDVVPDRLRSGT
jgi:diaminopimelate decarboxylase